MLDHLHARLCTVQALQSFIADIAGVAGPPPVALMLSVWADASYLSFAIRVFLFFFFFTSAGYFPPTSHCIETKCHL